MSSNDFVFLFQYLFGDMALGLFAILFALLVWDAGVTLYRRRKWEALEEISLDDPAPANDYELKEVTA